MYQHCRWYDLYPKLAFVLQLVRLMPEDRQSYIGYRLNQFLNHRAIQVTASWNNVTTKNRWYDEVYLLLESLERLKSAPHLVKEQSTDFLIHLLEEADNPANCA